MTCELCGGPLKTSTVLGVCMRNPNCRQEHRRREHTADNLRKRRPHGICEVCGGPVRLSSQTGVCVRNPECRRERDRRNYAANPQRKLQADKRYREARRAREQQRRARRAAERNALREAERARFRECIVGLREQGWSKAAIRRELGVGTPFIAEVLRGMPGGACKLCGGPMKSGSISGICERNPECKRARVQFATRFKAIRVGNRGPNDLTARYLISIWTGRCARLGCDKTLNPVGVGRRDDAASLDRIIPADGYVQGNVRWLCGRCNRWKQDMTSADMRAMLLDQLQAERCR